MSKCEAGRQKELLRTGSSSGQRVEEGRREVIREGAKEVRGDQSLQRVHQGVLNREN